MMTLFFVIVGFILVVTLMPVLLEILGALLMVGGGAIVMIFVALAHFIEFFFVSMGFSCSWLWQRASRWMPIFLGVGTLLLITLLAYLSKNAAILK